MIPTTKIVALGPGGKFFIPFAKEQLSILKRQQELGLRGTYRTVTPFDGVVVECWSEFRRNEIRITVSKPKPSGKDRARIKKEVMECLCFPHFAMGIITDVRPYEPETIEAYRDILVRDRFLYDVDICSKAEPDIYIGYEDAVSIGWERYNIDQIVLVTFGQKMDEWEYPLDCDRECLIENPRFDSIAISPMFLGKNMKRWDKDYKTVLET